MRTIALRLSPGADLVAELLALAARERLQAGWMLTWAEDHQRS
jgi:predicted DNA-binding protein with PD1-like motif